MPYRDVRRRVTAISFAIGFGSLGVLTLGAKTIPPAFPPYVQQALAAAAKKTRVPVLGPLWIPNRTAASSRLGPKDGTFAASLQSSRTAYAISWYYEPHALSVNNSAIAQDSTDPQHAPMLTVEGIRYPSRAQARAAVFQNVFNQFTQAIPKSATHATIAKGITADVWRQRTPSGPNGKMSPWDNIAWRERGWLIVTAPNAVFYQDAPQTQRAYEAEAVTWGKPLISKVMAPMPGMLGTISVQSGGGGVSVKWQRGRIVYAVYVPYGLSPATTVVGSLYPYVAFFHRS